MGKVTGRRKLNSIHIITVCGSEHLKIGDWFRMRMWQRHWRGIDTFLCKEIFPEQESDVHSKFEKLDVTYCDVKEALKIFT
jgi:hypothetical protein